MRRQDDFRGGGRLTQRLAFYTIDDSGSPSNSLAREPELAFRTWGNLAPFQGVQSRDADRVTVEQRWATLYVRYQASRLPQVGMRFQVQRTGEWYTVEGVQPIDYANRKVELTVKLIQ